MHFNSSYSPWLDSCCLDSSFVHGHEHDTTKHNKCHEILPASCIEMAANMDFLLNQGQITLMEITIQNINKQASSQYVGSYLFQVS